MVQDDEGREMLLSLFRVDEEDPYSGIAQVPPAGGGVPEATPSIVDAVWSLNPEAVDVSHRRT